MNRDGNINILDLVFVASQFGQSGETVADINGDGTVNIRDLVLVADGIGCAAAPSVQTLTATQMREWLRIAKEEETLSVQRSVA